MSQRTAQIVLSGIVLVVLGLAAFFCLLYLTKPDDEKIKREFAVRNPGVEVIYASVGEGDFENAWFYIGYKMAGEEEVKERIVLYQRDGTEWKTNSDLRIP